MAGGAGGVDPDSLASIGTTPRALGFFSRSAIYNISFYKKNLTNTTAQYSSTPSNNQSMISVTTITIITNRIFCRQLRLFHNSLSSSSINGIPKPYHCTTNRPNTKFPEDYNGPWQVGALGKGISCVLQ